MHTGALACSQTFMPLIFQAPAEPHMLRYQFCDSPVGPLRLGATDAGLHFIEFAQPKNPVLPLTGQEGSHPIIEAAQTQLSAYFAGQSTTFDLPLAPQGTPFQLAVWQALTSIDYGRTCSYGQLAHGLGRPKASRAVGAANARNPLPIVVPCHRVVGANGALTGFSGGLDRKIFLLNLEQPQHPLALH